MTGAPYTNPAQAPPVTARSFARTGLSVLLLAGIFLAGLWWFVRSSPSQKASLQGEKPAKTTWKKQSVYPPQEEAKVAEVKAAEDTLGPRLLALERQQKLLLEKLEALAKRKPPVPPATPARDHPKAPRVGEAFFLSNKLELPPNAPQEDLYTLAPGATKIPCQVETAINSAVEGYFTAKVTSAVYDTATGQHLLIPQNSTILANTQSSQLIYGSERLDTISLRLAFADGRDVDLGHAPVHDQIGQAGLTGDIDRHFWRLFGAVFVGGALKGGMTAMQTAMTDAAGAGQVATGISTYGNQVTTQVLRPVLDTRPTIRVSAGQLCTVILLKPLDLPAMWQGGPPPIQRVTTPPYASSTSTTRRP